MIKNIYQFPNIRQSEQIKSSLQETLKNFTLLSMSASERFENAENLRIVNKTPKQRNDEFKECIIDIIRLNNQFIPEAPALINAYPSIFTSNIPKKAFTLGHYHTFFHANSFETSMKNTIIPNLKVLYRDIWMAKYIFAIITTSSDPECTKQWRKIKYALSDASQNTTPIQIGLCMDESLGKNIRLSILLYI